MLTEHDLIAYLENTLSPAERARVEPELERAPHQRRQLVQQAQLDAALRAALASDATSERVKQSVLAVLRGEREEALKQRVLADASPLVCGGRREPAQTSPWRCIAQMLGSLFRRPAFAFGFTAVCLLVVAAVWFGERPGTTVAEIELPARVDLANGSTQPKAGETVRAGSSISATMKFADGTTLHLEPGTEIRLEPVAIPPRRGGKQLTLLAGSLSADVARQPEGLPLLIQTPHALVTVVGTEFDLSVATNQTALEVTHGLVKMTGAGDARPVSVAAGEFAVAAPRAPLRYGRLARNPYRWPFSNASIWNRPLGSDAQFAPVPGKGFLADGPLNAALRPRRPFLGSATDPLRRIWVDGEVRADIRLPDVNLPQAGMSDSLVLLQHARRHALELRGVTVRADGDLEAKTLALTDLAGAGVDDTGSEPKPFGLSNLGGLLRSDEWEGGIRHALAARVSRDRFVTQRDGRPATIWPATAGDATDAVGLRIGTLLAIPPDVDIIAKFGTNGAAHELARALQDYGVYVTGTAPAPFVLLADNATIPRADEWLNQLVPLLQVVTNNSPALAGKPRREPAPELPGESK